MTESTTSARGAAYWIAYAITVISAITLVVFAVIAVVDGGVDADNADALWAAALAIALVVIVLVAPIFSADSPLLLAAVAMTIAQGIGAFVAAIEGELGQAIGAAVLCLATLTAATVLARSDRDRDRD